MSRIAGRFALAIPLLLAGTVAVSISRSPGVEPLHRQNRPEAGNVDASATAARAVQLSLSAPRYVGVSSCAASNCHGGGSMEMIPGSEYSLWIQKDHHALAYTVLYDEQSAQIIRNLKGSLVYRDIEPAYEERRCLVCHSPASAVSDAAAGSRRGAMHNSAGQDGVGCEACHGPAEHWLEPHKRPEWQNWSAERKSQLGFRDTKHLLNRARMCADCHVGAPGRDVNHDLIAAGHPRLNFELSAYQAIMPAHWDRNDDRRRHAFSAQADDPAEVKSYLETKLWLLGQATAAEAALELLEARATHETAPWPEFAEYGCFACHHDLQAESWRQQRGYEGRRPGDYPWGTWSFSLVRWASQETGGPNPLANRGGWQQLRGMMGSPVPDRETVAARAARLKQQMAEWAARLNRQEYSVDTLRNLLAGLTSDGQALTAQHWNAAAQVYLAAVALHQGYADAQGRIGPRLSTRDKQISAALESIRDRLVFPVEEGAHGRRVEYDSPKTFGPNRVEDINEHLSRIKNLVE